MSDSRSKMYEEIEEREREQLFFLREKYKKEIGIFADGYLNSFKRYTKHLPFTCLPDENHLISETNALVLRLERK